MVFEGVFGKTIYNCRFSKTHWKKLITTIMPKHSAVIAIFLLILISPHLYYSDNYIINQTPPLLGNIKWFPSESTIIHLLFNKSLQYITKMGYWKYCKIFYNRNKELLISKRKGKLIERWGRKAKGANFYMKKPASYRLEFPIKLNRVSD